MMMHRQHIFCVVVLALALVGGVRKKQAAAVARPTPPPAGDRRSDANGRRRRRRRSPSRGRCRPSRSPRTRSPARDIGDINKNSPFQPVFFALDSSEVDAAGQQALNANAEIMKKYPTWVITDRRARRRARHRGIQSRARRAAGDGGADLSRVARHLRPIGCGPSATARNFPFDPGHDEAAWAQEPAGAVRAYQQVGIGAREEK